MTRREEAEGAGEGPLRSLRVLDFSNYIPGPFCTQILADLGAVVIKVERPGSGDLQRTARPSYFDACNRGKRSIALDMRDAADREVCFKLAAEADVVVEGFRPGVADRMGIGFDALAKRRPGLIYVSLPTMPRGSAYAQDRAHEAEIQARIGATWVASEGKEPRFSIPFPAIDHAAGMYAVIGILAIHSRPGHEAVHLEVPLMAAGVAWMFPMYNRMLQARGDPGQHARLPGSGVYRTSDGRYLTMSSVEDASWRALCEAIGRPDLGNDPQMATLSQRVGRFAEIETQLCATMLTRPLAEWEVVLRAAQVSVGPVLEPVEAWNDSQLRSLGIMHDEPTRHVDLPIAGVGAVLNVRAPALDEHGAALRAAGWKALEP